VDIGAADLYPKSKAEIDVAVIEYHIHTKRSETKDGCHKALEEADLGSAGDAVHFAVFAVEDLWKFVEIDGGVGYLLESPSYCPCDILALGIIYDRNTFACFVEV